MRKENLLDQQLPAYPVLSEETYEKTMDDVVMPYLRSIQESFDLTAQDGHPIHAEAFRLPENKKGTVMISHGCTESCTKFHEMAWYFLQEGYDVCAIDHRGHGHSKKDPAAVVPTHVDHFSDYITDFHQVVETVLKTHPAPYILYAHSMGGGIGVVYMQAHPEVFSKAVLNAPMLDINRGGIPLFAAKVMAYALCVLGKGNDFLMGQGTFRETENFASSAGDSEARYHYYFRQQMADSYLRNHGSSCRWALESFLACERALKPENCAKVQIPVLLFQAEKDDYVLPEAQDKFISSIADGRILFVSGSKHEIYFGPNWVLSLYLRSIMQFLEG